MKLVVTGGAGFIGSAFIRYWLGKYSEDEITNLDALTYAGNLANLALVANNPRYYFEHGNILDQTLVARLIGEVDTVVHFAAESHVTRSEDNPTRFRITNVMGTSALLAAALERLWRTGQRVKFVHISTDEVYGPIKEGYFKEEDFRPGLATSAYAQSKAHADMMVRLATELAPTVVRPTNNFGPYQHPEKALPRWITNALSNQPLKVWGDGQQTRDWLYMTDTVKAIELIINEAEPGSIFNIGANHAPEHTNLEMAKRVLDILNLPESMIEKVPDPRPDHDERYGVDTTLIQRLGWKPGIFEIRLQQTIRWYQDHPEWWQPLKAGAEALYKDKEKS